jgi:hypothetical protein
MAAVTTNGEGSSSKERPPSNDDDGAAASEGPSGSASTPDPSTGSTAGHVCNVAFCPIGLAISAIEPLRPDAVEHLLVAGRELFLAMRTIVDARADQFGDEATRSTFEKIDIG